MDQAIDFIDGAFARFNMAGAGWNNLGKEPVSPWARITYAAGNSRQPNLKGGPWRIRKHQRGFEVSRAQTARDGPEAFVRGERHGGIDARVLFPQSGELLVREQCDLGSGKRLAQSL